MRAVIRYPGSKWGDERKEIEPMRVDMNAVIDAAPQNQVIQNTLMKMDLKLDHFKDPVCSVSGGSDSDIMMDLIERVRGGRKVTYVFFNTGIEYRATLRHLNDLEERYGIEIQRRDAAVSVPKGCQEFGQPFYSKMVAQYIGRLQAHGFKWEDASFDVLIKRYPGCESALRWWCSENGDGSSFNILNASFLKEFILLNPPMFSISEKCCQGAKKDPGKDFDKEIGSGMKMMGLRRAEGGQRATAFTSCFSMDDEGFANYRPLWFWSDADKLEYKQHYGVVYSDCYEVWGFKRTGCAGCPFNSRFEDDLATMERFEPQMAIAANNIFGESYEYTRAYRKFRDEMKAKNKGQMKGQMGFDDL